MNERSISDDEPGEMCVPASTRLPCQPWRSRSAASRRSANTLFLWRKSVPRQSRKPGAGEPAAPASSAGGRSGSPGVR